MAVEAHVDKLKNGPGAWNDWRRANPDVVPDLSGVDLGGTDVTGADFRLADLRGAQLGSVVGLLPASLAGADLTRAELPAELSDFPGLPYVAEISKHARVNFLAVVASCVFCWLTIAQTSDGALISNRGEMPLPVINTKVPVTGFFLFAPAILLALYVYLLLYLQRMWDALSRLPAIFPDGARLDQKAFPWLLSGLVSLYVTRLRQDAPPFTWLQVLLSVAAAWLLVPATIAWFWLRYLLVTDEPGIAWHVILLALAISFGLLTYRRAHVTLRGRRAPPVPTSAAGPIPAARFVTPLMVIAVSLGASVGATYALRLLTDHWHLVFTGEEIAGQADLEAEVIKKLKRPDLRQANLRHAEGREAILFRVDLRQVDLSFSQLHNADLRWADLQEANLTGARLVGARLEGALLANTRLDGADLTRASPLTAEMLAGACGEGVTLPSGLSVEPCDSAEPQVAIGAFAKTPGDGFRDCGDVCPEMVVIPAGAFVMGSPEDEEGRRASEGPQHGVRIAAPFAVGKFEVTFAEWDACVADGGCGGYEPDDRGWGREQRPVISVSWNDTQTYVAWLSERTGKPYRLLSEAEWEYVARAGTTTAYSTGAKITNEQANFGGDLGKTAPVGSYPANAFGVHDMHGNVWEWTEDCWNDSYSGAPDDETARTSGDCDRRVLRGGSWIFDPRGLRSASRVRDVTDVRNDLLGFRIARTLTP